MFVTDISKWKEFGKAHREFFASCPPTTTMIEVKSLIDPEILIEIEADAFLGNVERPTVAVGHTVHYVSDVGRSELFYKQLGMRSVLSRNEIAILELRGGTHLILFPRKDGQSPAKETPFDLMVDDVDAYKIELAGNQIEGTEVRSDKVSGHKIFEIKDPDGFVIAICSSHTNGRPV